MGGGSWTTSCFTSYSESRGRAVLDGLAISTDDARQEFEAKHLHDDLDLKGKIRECRETEEHPDTLPVIIALDVTGSMGKAAVRVRNALDKIMTSIAKNVSGVEVAVAALGDIEYDDTPIQFSQFESDERIAANFDKVYFEAGGGGNSYESYSLVWYAALHHTDLDCWKRGKKGVIITLGDEPLNPSIKKKGYYASIESVLGDKVQGEIVTKDLYEEVSKKFDVYHIAVNDVETSYSWYETGDMLTSSWCGPLPRDHYFVATLDNLPSTISAIVTQANVGGTTAIAGTDGYDPGEDLGWDHVGE